MYNASPTMVICLTKMMALVCAPFYCCAKLTGCFTVDSDLFHAQYRALMAIGSVNAFTRMPIFFVLSPISDMSHSPYHVCRAHLHGFTPFQQNQRLGLYNKETSSRREEGFKVTREISLSLSIPAAASSDGFTSEGGQEADDPRKGQTQICWFAFACYRAGRISRCRHTQYRVWKPSISTHFSLQTPSQANGGSTTARQAASNLQEQIDAVTSKGQTSNFKGCQPSDPSAQSQGCAKSKRPETRCTREDPLENCSLCPKMISCPGMSSYLVDYLLQQCSIQEYRICMTFYSTS
jgi:hypothetical protein